MSKSIIADYAKNMCQSAFDNFESFKMYGGGRRGIVIGHSVVCIYQSKVLYYRGKNVEHPKFFFVKI